MSVSMLSRTDVAKTQVNMAIVVKNQGKLDRALGLYDKALKIMIGARPQSCERGDDKGKHGLCLQTTWEPYTGTIVF